MVVTLGLLAAALVAIAPTASASAGRKKCSSFASQKAAQQYFVGHGGSQSKNVSGLDPDGDGLVCADNPGPFAAYVELDFARGFFYGTVVCADYPAHRTKAEVRAEEKSGEEASKGGPTKVRPKDCASELIEVQLAKVGSRTPVASHKALAAPERTTLPLGASEKNAQGAVLSFEFKLVPKKTEGTFYAFSEECFGTRSRQVKGA